MSKFQELGGQITHDDDAERRWPECCFEGRKRHRVTCKIAQTDTHRFGSQKCIEGAHDALLRYYPGVPCQVSKGEIVIVISQDGAKTQLPN